MKIRRDGFTRNVDPRFEKQVFISELAGIIYEIGGVFTVDVGGNYEDHDGYFQCMVFFRREYPELTDALTVWDDIHNACIDAVEHGIITCFVYPGKYDADKAEILKASWEM